MSSRRASASPPRPCPGWITSPRNTPVRVPEKLVSTVPPGSAKPPKATGKPVRAARVFSVRSSRATWGEESVVNCYLL